MSKHIACFAFAFVVSVSAMAQGLVTVKGRVVDQKGRGIPNVVVNDGRNFTRTGKTGAYQLAMDTMEFKFVEISIPANCQLPSKKGIPSDFYVRVNRMARLKPNVMAHDFRLVRRNAVNNNFYYIAISDPQMNNAHDFNRWNNETVKDIRGEVSQLRKKREVVGMTLGDMVFDNVNMWKQYRKSAENSGMTFFQCIGNHDLDTRYADLGNSKKGANAYAEKGFERNFGPTDYSFNIGKIHVITIKNIDYFGKGKYVERLTPAELEWLKKDLSYVKKGTTVFLNMHAAGWNKWETAANMKNTAELMPLLAGYKVHVFCGHTHFYQNEVVDASLYQHNIGAACGAWWFGTVNRCGAPNGYLIVDVSGTKVKWHYKATLRPLDYQFRVYRQGEFRLQPEYVVANVWDYDRNCRVEWYEDGKPMGNMDQFLDQDEAYLRIERNKEFSCNTQHLFRLKPSAKAKTIKIVFINSFGEQYKEELNL